MKKGALIAKLTAEVGGKETLTLNSIVLKPIHVVSYHQGNCKQNLYKWDKMEVISVFKVVFTSGRACKKLGLEKCKTSNAWVENGLTSLGGIEARPAQVEACQEDYTPLEHYNTWEIKVWVLCPGAAADRKIRLIETIFYIIIA